LGGGWDEGVLEDEYAKWSGGEKMGEGLKMGQGLEDGSRARRWVRA